MPGVPIEMPSETVMVLNSTLLPPAASTPAAASRASSPMCMLQGVTFAQVEATPICGLREIRLREAHRAQHRARGGLLRLHPRPRANSSRGSGSFFFAIASLSEVPIVKNSLHCYSPRARRMRLNPSAPATVSATGSSERVPARARVQPLERHVREHACRVAQARRAAR